MTASTPYLNDMTASTPSIREEDIAQLKQPRVNVQNVYDIDTPTTTPTSTPKANSTETPNKDPKNTPTATPTANPTATPTAKLGNYCF